MRAPTLAVLALMLAGCAATPETGERWSSIAPTAIELETVPFHPQSGYECGPAALATVLGARGHDVTADALVGEIYIPERKGSLQPEIVAAARKRGLVVYSVRPDFEDLLRQLEAGHPVLILQNLGPGFLPIWHYAVVVGADPGNDKIVLRSGKTRRRIEPSATFLRHWRGSGNWGIVLLEPGTPPADPDWPAYLRAVADLEASGQIDAAARAYAAALDKNPSLQAARFGLANAKYRSGAYREAAELYTSIDTDPDFGVPALNNHANLQLDLGCHRRAEALLDRADRLSRPGDVYSAALVDTRARLKETEFNDADVILCP